MQGEAGEQSSRSSSGAGGFLARARRRGVLRVGGSYLVIGWLVLQIADVVLEPLGAPPWTMTTLIIAVALGFPVALLLAWFYEIGDHGIQRDSAAPGAPRPTVHGVRRYTDLIVIGVLLVTVAVLLVRQSDIGKPKPPENPAIAVLPFENLSGDPEQEYFSDGLAEEMLDRLGRVPGLRVIARSSSFGFKGQGVDARTIAAKLGVTTVLEGSVRRDGMRLRLSARLIDGGSGQQVWSGSFDREMNDIFAVQAELAAAVVGAIIPAARGAVAETAPPPTTDIDAYDLLLLARTKLNTRDRDQVREAIALAEQAIEHDPQFARAHALLGHALLFERIIGFRFDATDDAADLRRAEAAIFRALSLDPELSDARLAYATLLRDSGKPGAEAEYKRALELNPNNAAAWHDYGVYLSNVEQRFDEARDANRRSIELDPRSAVTWANYLGNLRRTRDPGYDQALDRAISLVEDLDGGLVGLRISLLPQGLEPHDARLDRLIERYAAHRGALDMSSIEAFLAGQPVTAMKLALAIERGAGPKVLPTWLTRFRVWTMVDLQRASRVLDGAVFGAARPSIPEEQLRLWMTIDTAGLLGDFGRLESAIAKLEAVYGHEHPGLSASKAFWLAVQDRLDEAAAALAHAEPIPDSLVPYRMGGSVDLGQMLPAQLRIYRATGRGTEAQRLAEQQFTRLRKQIADADSEEGPPPWAALAGLAANEGRREEAVEALREAMAHSPLPYDFRPELPWFRSLEGYAPYDELIRERERRIEGIRVELESLDPAG